MSSFCPDTGGRRWSLVQVRLFSRAVGREGHCRQISLACVGSTASVLATLGLPPLTGVCSPLHTAQVQVPGYSTKVQALLGLRFVPSPQLREPGA